MSVYVIIALCVLLLLAYIFDLSSKFTRIPSVVLLICLGMLLKFLSSLFNIKLPDLNSLLPILGSIGLILIVLEGSLELEVSRAKNGTILKSFLMALIPIVIGTAFTAWLIYFLTDEPILSCVVNALPLGVISSAIAIPSAKNLNKANKEFVVYESSFSDILGVLFFNFFTLNSVIDGYAFLDFGWQILLMLVLAFIATIILSVLLNNIRHHVKFAPIILLIILIYEISKVFHLPGLIFVLIFGLFIGNLDQLKRFKWIEKLNPDKLKKEVHKFGEIVNEGAFLVRASFFILFGFLLKIEEIVDINSILLAAEIFFSIVLIRILTLMVFKLPVFPLVFIAPRGLITILLFLSIPAKLFLPIINNSVIIQVILLSAFWMMFGLIINKSNSPVKEKDVPVHQ